MVAAQPWFLHTARVGSVGAQGQAATPTPIRADFRPSRAGADSTRGAVAQGSYCTAHPLPQPPWRPGSSTRSTSGPDFWAAPTNLTAAQATVLPPACLLPGHSTPGRGRSVSHACEGRSPSQQATLSPRGCSGTARPTAPDLQARPAWSSCNGPRLTLTARALGPPS